MMNSKNLYSVIAITLLAVSCMQNKDKLPICESAKMLKLTYHDWVEHGSPLDWDPSNYIGSVNGYKYYSFTNKVSYGGKIYHCRFAASIPNFPTGIDVITDEGVTMWIRTKDNRILFSPDKNLPDDKDL